MIELIVPLYPRPKSRPRVTRYGVFYPKTYTKFREDFAASVKGQWAGPPMEGLLGVTIDIFCTHCRGDVDNCAGGVLDALQDSGVFANDRAVKRLVAHIHEDKAHKQPSIVIRISQFSMASL